MSFNSLAVSDVFRIASSLPFSRENAFHFNLDKSLNCEQKSPIRDRQFVETIGIRQKSLWRKFKRHSVISIVSRVEQKRAKRKQNQIVC